MKLLIQDNLTQFLFYLPKDEAISPLFCYDGNIIALRELLLIQSIEFPDVPLYPVPFYCIPCLLACGYPKPTDVKPVLIKNDCKMCCMISLP